MIAGLLLAAGRSRRFGGDKLLAPLSGYVVLQWSARALAGAVEATYVVIPAGDEGRAGALAGLGVTLVEHPGRDDGMGSSIAAGIAALPPHVDAVVIALADQPLVAPAVIAQLCACWRATGARAVAPRYRDGRGHPVLFGHACLAALAALRGDAGARAVLESLGDGLHLVDIDDDAPLDVDTMETLETVRQALAVRRGG